MKRMILLCSTFLILALAACGAPQSSQQTAEEGDKPIVTVYRPST